MVSLARNTKRPVWVASHTIVNGVRTYGTPVLHNWNWRGLNSGADMFAFGPEYMDYRKAVTTNADVENLKRFDAVWMDTTPANPSDQLASDADFYVLGVTPGQGGVAEGTFKRMSADG